MSKVRAVGGFALMGAGLVFLLKIVLPIFVGVLALGLKVAIWVAIGFIVYRVYKAMTAPKAEPID